MQTSETHRDWPDELQQLVHRNTYPLITVGEFCLIYEALDKTNRRRFLNCLLREDRELMKYVLENTGIGDSDDYEEE